MRKVELKNEKLVKVLKERGLVLTDARKVQKEVEKLQKQQQKYGYKMNRLKDKTEPLMEKENIETGEFEVISRLFVEKDKAYAEIVDQVEEYKKMLRGKKDEDNSDNSTDK